MFGSRSRAGQARCASRFSCRVEQPFSIASLLIHSDRAVNLPSGTPMCHPELQISTPPHTKHPGWYVGFGFPGDVAASRAARVALQVYPFGSSALCADSADNASTARRNFTCAYLPTNYSTSNLKGSLAFTDGFFGTTTDYGALRPPGPRISTPSLGVSYELVC